MKHITSKLQVTNDNVANVIFVDQKNALTKELNSLMSERNFLFEKEKSRFLELVKEEHSKIKIPKKLLEAANLLVKHSEGNDFEVVPTSFEDIKENYLYLYNRHFVFPYYDNLNQRYSKWESDEISIQVKVNLKIENNTSEEEVFSIRTGVTHYLETFTFKRPKTIYTNFEKSKIEELSSQIVRLKDILSKEDALKLEIEAFVTRKAIHDNPEYEGLNLEEFRPLLLS